VLHIGRRWPNPPVVGLVEFEASLWGKLEAACRWILDYRP
jgi:hypothetical protein